MKLDTLTKWVVFIILTLVLPVNYRTCGQTNPVVTLLANHYGHKEYDDPSGYYTFINYTSVVSLQFSAQLPSKINSTTFESRIGTISGYIHFTAHAEDHYFGDDTIDDYYVPVSYSWPAQDLYIDFLASDGSVNWISTSLPYFTNDTSHPRIYGLKYVGGLMLLTNLIRMPDPFDYDLSDNFTGPAVATVTGNGSSFSGLVEDASTGNPLVGATVVIGGQTLTTDAIGKFFVPLLPPGSLTIQITDTGYVPYQATKILPPFSAIQQTFKLTNAPLTINPLRLSLFTANVTGSDAIDNPIVPVTTAAYLSTASPLGMGVVADDVTPVLFQFNGAEANYTIQITHNATSYNGSLSDHLFVLQDGAWTPTTSLTISSSTTPAYAYLSGLTWTDFSGTPANGVTITVNLYLAGGSTPIASTN